MVGDLVAGSTARTEAARAGDVSSAEVVWRVFMMCVRERRWFVHNAVNSSL